MITDTRDHRVVEIDDESDLVVSWKTFKLPSEADHTGVSDPVGGPSYDGVVNNFGVESDGERHLPMVGSSPSGFITRSGCRTDSPNSIWRLSESGARRRLSS